MNSYTLCRNSLKNKGRLVAPIVVVVVCSLFPAIANADGPSTRPALPTLFIIGDSTVRNGTKGEEGWGDPIKSLFDLSRINIENRAKGGRSSRTFRTEGLWKKVLDDARPGDFVIMQFGHNDGGPLDDERARGSIRGMGDATKEVSLKDGTHETVHTFGWYMEQYLTDAKAKGMTPIICSFIPHCPTSAVPASSPGPTSYALWAKEAAEDQHASFIDLNHIIFQHYVQYTPERIKSTFFTGADNTHTSPTGAELNAHCVVEGIRQMKDCPLNGYLLPEKNQ